MAIPGFLREAVYRIAGTLFPGRWKEYRELSYWRQRKRIESELSNAHYEYFYTGHFGIEKSFYTGKVLLDIGCGPRGSLEWADRAGRRIGLDPLAEKYLKLGADKHHMEYMASGSENIPLEDGTCDVIFAFNSLDHVEDIDKTVQEIKRCLAPEGIFLLLVEVNHPPTACEPHMLTPGEIIDSFSPELEAVTPRLYKPVVSGMYQSIEKGKVFSHPLDSREKGYFSVKFIRKKQA